MLARAREIYIKVIKAAITYRAPIFYMLIESDSKPKGLARNLVKKQLACLKTILRAYKATPIY